jgi:integrase
VIAAKTDGGGCAVLQQGHERDLSGLHASHLVTFQVLRRSCATRNQKHGSMKDVQSHLRHARIETTGNVYMQPVAASVQQMVEADITDILGVPLAAKNESLLVN